MPTWGILAVRPRFGQCPADTDDAEADDARLRHPAGRWTVTAFVWSGRTPTSLGSSRS